MSDEIKAIAAGTVLIIGAIVAGYIKLRNNTMKEKGKDRIAGQKVDQSAIDHLIEKYKDLIEEGKKELRTEITELREQMKHYQTEHFECAKKIVLLESRLAQLEGSK